MLIEAARRAEAAAKEMLDCINAGSAPCTEVREALEVSKAFMAVTSAFQVGAARVIAKVERHGDGGTQVLADTAGMSRREAHSQVKTARVIEAAPAVRDAVETGSMSQANARRLAEVIEKTSAADVESDGDLLAKAQTMRPEQFTKEARRWAADRQHDGGEADYRRLRARRYVRIWDSDDGTVELHAKFDPVAGRRIGNRLQAEARRLYDIDKKSAGDRGDERRSFNQCMADALDNLTASNTSANGKPFADICVVAHLDDATGKLVAETPEGQRLPQAVLEELACNAKFTGVLYDRVGKPIWRAHPVRAATEVQRQILFALYGGCFHCGANPAMCQIHHIKPVSQGGSTKLENMVPACWDCHNRIHHQDWYIRTSPDGRHTLHPPDRVHYGPALAPEQPLLFKADTAHDSDPPPADRSDGADPPEAPPPRATAPDRQPQTPQPSESRTQHEIGPTGPPDRPARREPGSVDIDTPLGLGGPATARAALRRAMAQRNGIRGANPEDARAAPTSPMSGGGAVPVRAPDLVSLPDSQANDCACAHVGRDDCPPPGGEDTYDQVSSHKQRHRRHVEPQRVVAVPVAGEPGSPDDGEQDRAREEEHRSNGGGRSDRTLG